MMIILAFLLITLGFMVWPALSRRSQAISQEAENLRLYEQRKREIVSADYGDDEREQLLLELDYELIGNEEDRRRSTEAKPKQKMLTALVLFIIMISGVVFIYQDMGAQDELMATQLLNKMSTSKLTDAERATLKNRLRDASQSNPGNTEWLYLYARVLFADGQYVESADLFERVLVDLPLEAKADRAAALVQIAQAKFYIANQVASESIYEYVERALELEPGHPQGLGLAGILAYELNKNAAAFEHWKALWFNMSSSPEAASLENGIQQIAERLKAEGTVVDLSWMRRAEVKVNVSISAELKAQLNDNDAVFVMAKAVSGPVMPLAAMRVMAKDLPLQVVLNDSQGMVPGLALSKFDEVQIIARVAKGGQPMANPGDLQGIVKPVLVNSDEVVKLVIDQVVE